MKNLRPVAPGNVDVYHPGQGVLRAQFPLAAPPHAVRRPLPTAASRACVNDAHDDYLQPTVRCWSDVGGGVIDLHENRRQQPCLVWI